MKTRTSTLRKPNGILREVRESSNIAPQDHLASILSQRVPTSRRSFLKEKGDIIIEFQSLVLKMVRSFYKRPEGMFRQDEGAFGKKAMKSLFYRQ